jgi:hypothetical protein
VFVQGTFAGYHYLPGLAIGAIFVGSMFTIVTDVIAPRLFAGEVTWRRMQALAAVLLIVAASSVYLSANSYRRLASGQFLRDPRPGEMRNGTVFDYTEDVAVASYLRAHTAPADPIFVWGYESLVYYFADRYPPARFQMTTPLVLRADAAEYDPMQQRWRAELVRDLTARPPAYVAVVRDDHWWWAPNQLSSEELVGEFPALKALIDRDYVDDTTIGRFRIYRRRGMAADAVSQRPTT